MDYYPANTLIVNPTPRLGLRYCITILIGRIGHSLEPPHTMISRTTIKVTFSTSRRTTPSYPSYHPGRIRAMCPHFGYTHTSQVHWYTLYRLLRYQQSIQYTEYLDPTPPLSFRKSYHISRTRTTSKFLQAFCLLIGIALLYIYMYFRNFRRKY